MTLEKIKELKRLHGYTNEQISQRSGVPLATVQKVLGGTTRSPRYQTIQALCSAFPEYEKGADPLEPAGELCAANTAGYAGQMKKSDTLLLRDAGAAYAAAPVRNPFMGTQKANMKYPRQGTYTLDDYLALPDDQRVELIDGYFFDMSAPSIPHQLVGGKIHAKFLEYITRNGGSCMPFIAPTDVLLDPDRRTIVQPDVMVVCDRSKITRARIVGAPDLVIEVLSPGTRAKDILIKSRKYRDAGVREYWIVDVKNELVTRMLFGDESQRETDEELRIDHFPFDTPVPVFIFDEKLSVNFREIADTYSFLEES